MTPERYAATKAHLRANLQSQALDDLLAHADALAAELDRVNAIMVDLVIDGPDREASYRKGWEDALAAALRAIDRVIAANRELLDTNPTPDLRRVVQADLDAYRVARENVEHAVRSPQPPPPG